MRKIATALLAVLLGLVLFSACKPATFQVTLKNGYAEDEIIEVDDGDEFTLPDIERDDYILLGWTEEGEDEILPAGEKVVIKGPVVYIAQWEAVVEKVTIIFKDGENTLDTKQIEKGAELTFPECEATHAGQAFDGWLFNEKVYKNGEKLTVTVGGEAVAQWKAIEYTVLFVKDGETVKTETLYYGDMPSAPEMQDEIVDESTIRVFKGWTPEIAAVDDNQTYTAVYEEQARLYAISFPENEYVEFLNAEGEAVTQATREYNQAYTFTVRAFAGVRTENMRVLCNGEELTAQDGVYSAPFAAETEIAVEGAYFAEYRIDFTASHAIYRAEKPETVVYGSVITVYAVGDEWYTDVAPVVTYAGEAVEASGTENIEGTDYYVYEISADRNGTVSITGVEDIIPVTFVDLNGEETKADWSISKGGIGILNDIFYVNTWGSFLLNGTTKLYSVPYVYDSNYDTFVALTGESLDSYFVEQAEGEAIAQALADTPLYPEKGAENVYHLIYYYVGEDESGSGTDTEYSATIGFMSPIGSDNFRYFIEGVSDDWVSCFYERAQNSVNQANFFELCNADAWNNPTVKFGEGAVVYLAMNYDGTLPEFTNIYTGKTLTAQTWQVNGEQVLCYKIVVTQDGNWYECEMDTVMHTITFDPLEDEKEEYDFYTMRGYTPAANVSIRDGDSWTFQISYNLDKTTILDWFEKQSDGTYLIKEGKTPFEFLSSYDVEYTYKTNVLGEYDSFLEVYVTLKNIVDDVTVKAYCESNYAEFLFKIEEGYTIYVDDVAVTGEVGETVTANVKYYSLIRLVPDEGTRFIDINGDSRIAYYYFNADGESEQYENYSFGVAGDGSYAYFEFSEFYLSWYSPVDSSKPVEFLGIMQGTHIATHAEKYCASSDGLNNITFPDGKTVGADVNNVFSLKVKLPFGHYPVLYIEYADRLDESFYAYQANSTAQEGSYSVFTFEVGSITSDFNWYLGLEANEYDITVHYGEESETVTLTHGQILADAEALRKSYEGTLEGQKGVFTVIGWSTEEGGDQNVLLVAGPDELWAVTEFTPYSVTFGESGYLTLADALKDLDDSSEGNLDLLWGTTQELKSGDFTLPAGVTLRLPYAENAYGRKLAELSDSPSIFYADESKGTVMLAIGEQATLTVYGTVSVGGIVGYPQSARPYQGQTAADYAILQSDGQIVVEQGGLLEVNGYITGEGRVTLKSGATSRLPFIVKDYRGGTNSSNVYSKGCVPFNVYEMPNIQTEYVIHYGASEQAYAMLYALETFNNAVIEAIGANGILRVNEGGYIVKHTTQIDNPRYSESTKAYEPVKEFRTTLDIYGGGSDGAMELDLGMTVISTETMTLGIPYTYSSITLHDGEYNLYNMYKIMPGATLKVSEDAKLTFAAQNIGEKSYQGSVIVYEDTFAEDTAGLPPLISNKQLIYPAQPNGIQEGGKFIVNGTLEIRGKMGGEILTEVAGAKIFVYASDANLTVSSREAAWFSTTEFTVTYEQTSAAVVNTESGEKALTMGAIYTSVEGGFWK